MPEQIATTLLSYGAPGVIIAVLLAALRWLFLRYDAVQEARIEEGREIAKIATASAAALELANQNSALILAELEASRRLNMSVGILSARPPS